MDWVDNFTMVRGRHTIKAGMEETGYKENDCGQYSLSAPSWAVSASRDNGPVTEGWNLPSGAYGQSPGNAYADFLLGDAVSIRLRAPVAQRLL